MAKPLTIRRSVSLAIEVACLFLGYAAAAHGDQASAQLDASQTHDRGSNDSLHESYGNALHAVSNFFDMNIPGAVHYGVKAYGQYRNSNKLDDLRDRNSHLANTMTSMAGPLLAPGSGDASAPEHIPIGTIVPGTAPGQRAGSPYARLDKAFLREGATGEIAGRLEKLSGMSREKMFDLMADVHARSKSPADPDFVPWAMKTYRQVSAQMPNPEFRAKLDSLGGYLEKAVKSGYAQTVLAKFQAVDVGRAPATMLASSAPPPAEPEAAAAAAPAPAPAAAAPAPAARSDENGLSDARRFTERGTVSDPARRSFDRLQFEPVEGFLGDVFTKTEPEAEPSLFQTVSSKLKELTIRQQLERPDYRKVAATR